MSLIKNLVLDCDNYKHHLQYVHLVILSSVLKITLAPILVLIFYSFNFVQFIKHGKNFVEILF